MKKKLFLVLVLALLLFPFKCFALVQPTDEFYVNDSADILDTDVENYIMSRSKSLEDKTGAQIVVVTVLDLEGMSLEEYAITLFKKYGIGDKDKNNGLLLLFALEEKQFRVEVGYGLESVLPDGLTGRYQDKYITPYLKNNDWNAGIKTWYTAFYKKLCEHYDIEMDADTLAISDDYDFDFSVIFFVSSIIGWLQGRYCKRVIEKQKKKLSKVYVLFSILLLIVMFAMIFLKSPTFIISIFLKEFFWLFGRFTSKKFVEVSFIGGWPLSFSRHSSRKISGGGGSSAGGGSSRRF